MVHRFLQGSESIASWQANILFEPVQFEVKPLFTDK